MCQFTQVARWALGIRPYVRKSHYLLHYDPARTGARGVEGNGTASGYGVYSTTYGLTPEECRIWEALAQEHRAIRRMLADAERRNARGHG